MDYELCLSMGTVAGFVGVIMMFVIAKFRDRFGGRKVSAVLFIIFGLTFYFLFLRAENIVMYAVSQCIMVSCGQGCFYLCTGPMQSDWFPKKRGVVNGISTIGANIGTAVLAPLMTVLLTMAQYKTSLSVFAVAAVLLGGVCVGISTGYSPGGGCLSGQCDEGSIRKRVPEDRRTGCLCQQLDGSQDAQM